MKRRVWFTPRRRGEVRVRWRKPRSPVSLQRWLASVLRDALVLAVRSSHFADDRRARERAVRNARTLPEAFVRWQSNSFSAVYPGVFIEIAPTGMRTFFVRATPDLVRLLSAGGSGEMAVVHVDQTGTLLDARAVEE